MLERTKKINLITQAFATLSTNITSKSLQGLFDDNKIMEIILPDLLNQIYDCNLCDLNLGQLNHPAIDLGDSDRGLAVQITADGSKSKMVDTIGKLEKHGLNNEYKNIIFLIISNAPLQSFQRKGYNIEVINLNDIVRDICQLPPSKFDAIYQYCENQLRTYFHSVSQKTSLLKPIVLPSKDPSKTIYNFMRLNGIDLSDDFFNVEVEDIRNDLIRLKDKLSSLNEDERWLIFRVMKATINNNSNKYIEDCIIPLSNLISGTDSSEQYRIRNIAESLQSMNILYYEEDETYRYPYRHYSIHFMGCIDDFNYFCGICTFLLENSQTHDLENIIVHCDFSKIN